MSQDSSQCSVSETSRPGSESIDDTSVAFEQLASAGLEITVGLDAFDLGALRVDDQLVMLVA